jgi:hypothetical protein
VAKEYPEGEAGQLDHKPFNNMMRKNKTAHTKTYTVEVNTMCATQRSTQIMKVLPNKMHLRTSKNHCRTDMKPPPNKRDIQLAE